MARIIAMGAGGETWDWVVTVLSYRNIALLPYHILTGPSPKIRIKPSPAKYLII